jgi:hypothetical protein
MIAGRYVGLWTLITGLLAPFVGVAAGASQDVPRLGWLAAAPHLVLGNDPGNTAEHLFRVSGVAEMPGGRIAVVNGGTREVIFFSPEGRHLRTVGGAGDGPSEFARRPTLVPAQRYDSLLLETLTRVSVVRADGTVAALRRVDISAVRELVVAGELGGEFVLAGVGGAMVVPGAERGPRRSSVDLYVTRDPTAPLRRAAGVTYQALFSVAPGRAYTIPLTVPASWAVADGRMLIADGVSPWVISVDPVTLRESRIVIPVPQTRVSARDYRAALAKVSSDARDALRDAPRPEWRPMVRRLLADGAGGFWVELYDRAEGQGTRWLVFDSGGAALGLIETPAGLHVWQVGADFILGVAKDEWGVERVERYGLVRQPRGRI